MVRAATTGRPDTLRRNYGPWIGVSADHRAVTNNLAATIVQADERLVAAVAQIGDLPVLDRTVQRVLALCRSDDSSTTDLITALESDATFAANLLRYVNSAHAARPMQVHTLRQAVTMAGRKAIGRMAVEAVTCRFLERAPGNGRTSVGLMHVHASAVASCSVELAGRCGAVLEVAHLGGLLHDIGKLVMPLAFGERLLDEIAGQAPGGPARAALERELLGCDHALAGAMLASASQVDAAVVAAILSHHDADADVTLETACVQVANAVVGMLMGIDPDSRLLDRALTSLDLDAAVLDDVAVYAGQFGVGQTASPAGPLAARIAELEEQASTDELTGLANRRHWSKRAREQVDAGSGAVMVCDVDHFKHVNDRNGHATGDLVLCEIARILSHHGFAGRLGGDEFVVLCPVPAGAACDAAARILDDVRGAFPAGSIDGWDAGVSIGVAVVTPDRRDLGGLLKAADDALYEAKRAGRGRIAVAA
jgi:diguanylate cyclase (GGDEF)-like protein/putative nucleotidyltransferase with HDIG domain